MQILSHRGYWKLKKERNMVIAFKRSFELGFGVELDVRDYCGKLVVSHDIPDSNSLSFRDVLEIHSKYNPDLFLAINIKSNGLHKLLFALLNGYEIKNYFIFDMTIPDMLEYLSFGMKVFTRESEFEVKPLFYEKACGIWMDEFRIAWITGQKIRKHVKNDKSICIVSPELHRREHLIRWKGYKAMFKRLNKEKILFCTDFPEEARRFFDD